MERGEIDPTVDRDLVFDLIYGGLMYRVFVGETVDENAVQALADLVMNGAAGPWVAVMVVLLTVPSTRTVSPVVTALAEVELVPFWYVVEDASLTVTF